MKIALYDNLANNAYIQAKALRRHGYNVDLILDPDDHFVMSDPRWEDADIEIPQSASLGFQFSDESPWPSWVQRPNPQLSSKLRALLRRPQLLLRGLRTGGVHALPMTASLAATADLFRAYDLVVGFGKGPLIAYLANAAHIGQTWGGDITLMPFYDNEASRPPTEHALARLQRSGYQHNWHTFLSEPRYQAAAKKLGITHQASIQPLVVDVEKYAPDENDPVAQEIRHRYLGGKKRWLFFVPARQDFRWKGSDILFQGLAPILRSRDDIVVVAAGWGNDLTRSQALVTELGIEDSVLFHSHILSKTRLLRYYRASDLVFDQFTLASYGTAALEAMATGKPLVTYLDLSAYQEQFADPPPVLNAPDAQTITSQVERYLTDPATGQRTGKAARIWVKNYHYDQALKKLTERFDAFTTTSTRR